MSNTSPFPIDPRIGRVALWAMATFLILVIAIAAWVGVRGALAYKHLSALQEVASTQASQLISDPATAVAALTEISEDARAAHDLTNDPVWKLAELSPWLGPQLSALATISASANDLLTGSVLPLAAAVQGTTLDALKPVGGRLDTAAIASLAAPAATAAENARQAASAIDGINPTPLVGAVQRGVERVDEVFSQTADGLDALSRATQLLPGMLGSDGPRSYLLLVQNNAEARSLGGIAGTAVTIRTDGGKISLEETRSGTSISQALRSPVADVGSDVSALYGNGPARFFQNVTQVPDFSVGAPFARQMWQEVAGEAVDGVIAIDPVVLSYLLQATGPVTLQDGTVLTADDAASVLLNGVYKKYPKPDVQDAFFAQAASTIFSTFLNGEGSTPAIVSALSWAAEERRILVWSADEDEEATLAGTTFAGALPVTDAHTARFGVYLSDSGGSKMTFYVKPTVTLDWGACRTDGETSSREITLSVSLTSDAPLDAATTLPTYLTANGAFGVAPGNVATTGHVFLPEGWELVSATQSTGGSFANINAFGRQVLSFDSNLAPQASFSATILVRAISSADEAEAWVTPTADSSISPVVTAACQTTGVATLE